MNLFEIQFLFLLPIQVRVKFSKEDADISLDDEINDLYEKGQVLKEFKVDLDMTTWYDYWWLDMIIGD